MNKQRLLSKFLWLLIFTGSMFLASCKKDEAPLLAPEMQMSVENSKISLNFEETLLLEAAPLNNADYQQEWKVDGQVQSTASSLEFKSSQAGTYEIVYRAFNSVGIFETVYTILVKAKDTPVTEESSMYVTTLFEFLPAPGQFINKSLGDLASAESILGKRGMVSLGAWGGYVVLGFDHTVKNREGDDIMVYGNASAIFSEPGIIYVMQDENGNGQPDDTWYEIAGSDFGKEGYIRDYEVTYSRPTAAKADIPWKDNRGNTGVIARNNFHVQDHYYPEWVKEDEYTLKGTHLSGGNIDMSNPRFITSLPLEFGYADNKVGGDMIDLSNAVDKDGKKISLSGIDFIKIQTGIQANMGWLGELSTEVEAVADLSLVPITQ